jgi:hypothetical protein
MDEVYKTQFENHEERIKKLENNDYSNKEILIELKVQQKYVVESVNNLKDAVKTLTEKPMKEYDKIKIGLITGILTLIASSGITLLITKLLA